jgi:hypothetical protein
MTEQGVGKWLRTARQAHAVLPRTAYLLLHRRHSAFRARTDLGGTTIPSRLIRPRWFGDHNTWAIPLSAAFCVLGRPQREPEPPAAGTGHRPIETR